MKEEYETGTCNADDILDTDTDMNYPEMVKYLGEIYHELITAIGTTGHEDALRIIKNLKNMPEPTIKDRKKLNSAEAVFGFASWLTTRSEVTKMGASELCSPIAELCQRFCFENDLGLVSEDWPNNLFFPYDDNEYDSIQNNNVSVFLKTSLSPIVEDMPQDNIKCEFASNLHSTMDANVWAKEFCNTYRKLYNREIDEEWVHNWMCNAIMCGYDHQSHKRDKEYIYILSAKFGGQVIKIFHWEPTITDIEQAYLKLYDFDHIAYNVMDRVTLYRWSRSNGLMEMSGPKSDTQYEWKSN